jgi:hypothetical protein
MFFESLNKGAHELLELDVTGEPLDYHGQSTEPFTWTTETLDPRACSQLSSLTLDGIYRSGFPLMPSIRRLEFNSMDKGPTTIQICACVPNVEVLKLVSHWYPEELFVFPPAAPRPALPNLHHLYLNGSCEWVILALDFLPDPAKHLIVEPGFDDWTSEEDHGHIIIARMVHFWTGVTGAAWAWPKGAIEVRYNELYVPFGPMPESELCATPALFYEAACSHVWSDPVLEHVRTLRVLGELEYFPGDRIDLGSLSNVDSLIFEYVQVKPEREYARARTLWAWVEARCTQGILLRSIKFKYCSDQIGLIPKLVKDKIADETSEE